MDEDENEKMRGEGGGDIRSFRTGILLGTYILVLYMDYCIVLS